VGQLCQRHLPGTWGWGPICAAYLDTGCHPENNQGTSVADVAGRVLHSRMLDFNAVLYLQPTLSNLPQHVRRTQVASMERRVRAAAWEAGYAVASFEPYPGTLSTFKVQLMAAGAFS